MDATCGCSLKNSLAAEDAAAFALHALPDHVTLIQRSAVRLADGRALYTVTIGSG